MPDLDSATLDALRHIFTAKLTTQWFARGLRNMFMQEANSASRARAGRTIR